MSLLLAGIYIPKKYDRKIPRAIIIFSTLSGHSDSDREITRTRSVYVAVTPCPALHLLSQYGTEFRKPE